MESPKPPRRERRAQERATRKEQEAAKQSRRTLLKRLAAAAGVVGVGGTAIAVARSVEPQREKSLKEKVLSFTWKDAENKDKLHALTESLADGYLQLTQTNRLTKQDLTHKENIIFHRSEEEFLTAIRNIDAKYAVKRQRGYADYKNKRIYVSLEELRRSSNNAGLLLVDLLWHEWGHLDIQRRTTGEYINNPQALLVPFPGAKPEVVKGYHGGVMYSESHEDFQRFEETWIEAVTIKMMREGLGLQDIEASKDYYENGADILLALTKSLSYKSFYEMHATSNFEGFAKFVGEQLPGEGTPFTKGERLFIATHKNDQVAMRQTGVFERIPR